MTEFGFDWAIAPVSRDTFFATYFEKAHLVVHRQAPDYFANLLSLDEADQAITTMGLTPQEVVLTGEGEGTSDTDRDAGQRGGVPLGDYTAPSGIIDPLRVTQHVGDGATLILNGMQDWLPQLGRYARALEAALSCRVQTNLYMTPAGHQGFRPHYDSHDVLVLQIAGSKEWRIYDTPLKLPLPSQGFAPGTTPIGAETDRFVLQPGDTAYLPRGLVHDAVAGAEPSLHITTGLMFRTWADVMVEMVRAAAEEDPAFRSALPPDYWRSEGVPDAFVKKVETLVEHVADPRFLDAALDTFRKDFIATRPPRVEGQLAQVAALDTITAQTEVGVRPDLIYALETKGDALCLSVHGAEITFPDHVERPLRYALSTPRFAVEALPGRLDEDGKLVLVRRLIREGVLRAL